MSPDDFDRFVADNGNGLLRTAYLMVGDLHEAEDLVQEMLFKVASKWPRVGRMKNPAAYTRRILVNQALRGRAKRSRNRAELNAAPPAEAASDAALLDDELFDALAALPPRQRAALVLRYFLDLPETDYRPRARRSWRPRLAIGGGVAAVAGTVTAVLSLAGGASTAFAGWSARPTTPSPAQLQAAQSYCSAHIPDPNARTQQLVDSRGPYTIIVDPAPAASTQTYNFCTVGPGPQNASGWTSYPPVTPPNGKLFLWTDHTATDTGQDYGTMVAQAGPDVAAVDLTLTDGRMVTATVQNGWAVAWWPGSGHVALAQLTTSVS